MSINVGLRWEPLFPVTTKSGFVSHFDPAMFAANGHIPYIRKLPPGPPFRAMQAFPVRRHTSVTRRILLHGSGWSGSRGNGRMTIRAAYGIFYDLPPAIFDYAFSTVPPYGETVALSSRPVELPIHGPDIPVETRSRRSLARPLSFRLARASSPLRYM